MSQGSRLRIPSSWRRTAGQKSLRRNTLANLIGRVVPAALALFAIPILIATVGPEAYGLVGLSLAMESLFGLLDFGISGSVNREVARNTAAERLPQVNRDLLRTLEIVYWPIALLILALVAGGSGWLSEHVVRPTTISHDTVRFAFVMVGLGLAARWPISLYQAVLRGLQAQVLMNGIRIAGSVVRVAGGAAAVLLISPTIRMFFTVQLLGSVFEVLLIAGAAWRVLPVSDRFARFDTTFIRSIWRFALGFSALSMLIQLLYQTGLLAVAKFLPLKEAGFYSVALSLAGVIMFVPYAIHDATFPRFAGQVQRRDAAGFATTFQHALFVSTLWSVIIGMPIIFFAADILYLWTRSWSVASDASVAAALLGLGYLLHQIWAVHYVALTAAGKIRFPLLLTACLVPLAIVATVAAVMAKGALGAAATWAISNLLLAVGYFVYSRTAGGASETAVGSVRAVALMSCSGTIFVGVSALSGGSSVTGRLLAATVASLASLSVGLLWFRPAGLLLPWRSGGRSE